MTEHFRRPYMVEAHTQSPNGVSDPWHSHHRTLEEAQDQAAREKYDGAIATVYQRTLDDDYEEVPEGQEGEQNHG